MKPLLYIFNSKKFFFGVFFSFFLVFIFSLIVNHIIKNSNYRLSKIYSTQSIESSIFFIGNSRSVPFTQENLKTSKKILNLSNNSMDTFEVENIIKAIKEKKKDNKTIYVELTSLSSSDVQCQYSIFYDLEFYFKKDKIQEKCKRQIFFEKFIPASKINNELFYRILYYYFFPEKDQLWSNYYKMPESVCSNPKIGPFIEYLLSKEAETMMYKNSQNLLNKYSDNSTEILFFITPMYQSENFALNIEEKFLQKKIKNMIKLNSLLNKDFFKNCEMFADTLHISISGLNVIKNSNIFNKF
jgi:hypothetical protein